MSAVALAGCGGGQPKRASSQAEQKGASGPGAPQRGKQAPASPGSNKPIHVPTKPGGTIVISGRGVPRIYGPFIRRAPRYTASFEQSQAVAISVNAEPEAISNSVAPVLSAKGTTGNAGAATIPWRRFYLWVPQAAPTYTVRLVPQG